MSLLLGILMRAGSGTAIAISNYNVSDTGVGDPPPASSASITMTRDGNFTFTGNASGPAILTEWADPDNATVGDGYHARMVTGTGDSFTSGTMDTWLSLSSDRTWEASLPGGTEATLFGVHTLQISGDGGSSVLESGTITIDVSTVGLGGG